MTSITFISIASAWLRALLGALVGYIAATWLWEGGQ
jgi:hypothetical protein